MRARLPGDTWDVYEEEGAKTMAQAEAVLQQVEEQARALGFLVRKGLFVGISRSRGCPLPMGTPKHPV